MTLKKGKFTEVVCSGKLCKYISVQSHEQLRHQGDMKDDSAEILFQSFLQEATVSSSAIGSNVHSVELSIQHFLCQPWSHSPWEMVLERLLWRVTCPNHASFCLLTEQPKVQPKVQPSSKTWHWHRECSGGQHQGGCHDGLTACTACRPTGLVHILIQTYVCFFFMWARTHLLNKSQMDFTILTLKYYESILTSL